MVDDELVQKIDENLICQLQYFYADSNTGVEKAIQSFIRAFELDVAPLCRFGLVHLTENKYLLLIDMHHIITSYR
ncbi:hypothetical protein GPS65_19170 [Bacillus pumilus]|nr:hypothetical protein GPS65_19170 [Bacillus pumilus]